MARNNLRTVSDGTVGHLVIRFSPLPPVEDGLVCFVIMGGGYINKNKSRTKPDANPRTKTRSRGRRMIKMEKDAVARYVVI